MIYPQTVVSLYAYALPSDAHSPIPPPPHLVYSIYSRGEFWKHQCNIYISAAAKRNSLEMLTDSDSFVLFCLSLSPTYPLEFPFFSSPRHPSHSPSLFISVSLCVY